MNNPGMKLVAECGNQSAWLDTIADFLAGRTVTIDADAIPADTDNDNHKFVQAGSVIGIITASGLFRKCTATVATKDAISSAVVYYVDNAEAFVVGDEFSAYHGGAWLTSQTITAIELGTVDGDKITVDTTLGTAVSTGDAAKANDGSVDAIGVGLETVDCKNGDATVVLCKVAHLREAGMPYAVNGKNGTVPSAVKTALKALADCVLTIV